MYLPLCSPSKVWRAPPCCHRRFTQQWPAVVAAVDWCISQQVPMGPQLGPSWKVFSHQNMCYNLKKWWFWRQRSQHHWTLPVNPWLRLCFALMPTVHVSLHPIYRCTKIFCWNLHVFPYISYIEGHIFFAKSIIRLFMRNVPSLMLHVRHQAQSQVVQARPRRVQTDWKMWEVLMKWCFRMMKWWLMILNVFLFNDSEWFFGDVSGWLMNKFRTMFQDDFERLDI